MSILIQNEALFKDKLQKGICLFTGAGFSVLESPSGNRLPNGNELCKDVVSHFELAVSEDEMNDLPYVSELCPESDYQNYLRSKFRVTDYNPLYNALNRIKLKAFITTNIDNIIELVIENGDRFYLKNIREYGATTGGSNEVVYIPLHGSVSDASSKLYFGKFELADVDLDNSDLFAQMKSITSANPVLFWGYNFNDSGVIKIVKKIIEKNPSNVWVQVLPTDLKNKRLFESKGCHIICADTKNLLQWIEKNCVGTEQHETISIHDESLKKYRIPNLSDIPTIPSEDYYRKGVTEWYPIIQGVPFERSIVAEAENLALLHKNVIVSGCHFSGKTTILMQLARKVNCENKFYLNGITKEEASFIVKRIQGQEAWIFYNNCCNDIDAFLVFAKASNIKIIGCSDDYILETVRHILSGSITYKIVNCSEIGKEEAQRMYNSILGGWRTQTFKYSVHPDEKYTMFEFITKNIRKAYTEKQIERAFSEIKGKSPELFKVVALASYMSRYGSAISYQNVAHLLNQENILDAVEVVKKVKDYLRLYNVPLCEEAEYEDFFVLRSKIFNLCAEKILTNSFKQEYRKIIRWIIKEESVYAILRYDIFRRKAFDAELFKSVFPYEEAIELYRYIHERDGNPYTLQQMALCQSLFGDYEHAFANIDLAMRNRPNNFSFKNSRAIILFESNHKNHVPESVEYMKRAMVILEQCYANDKRKLYHAQKFSEFALILSLEYSVNDYLETALKWMLEMTENDPTESPRSKQLKERLRNRLSLI